MSDRDLPRYPSLSLPRYVALGKWPNLSVPLLHSMENKDKKNNNTYFGMRLKRVEVCTIHGAFTLGRYPKYLFFIIFLKFSQQLYEVDSIISPSFTEENTESLRDKAACLKSRSC